MPEIRFHPLRLDILLTDLYPVLEICSLDEFTGECDQVVASFSRDSRSKKDRIKVKSKKYELKLKTSDHQLEPGVMYRMRVMLGSAELGIADMLIEEKGVHIDLLPPHRCCCRGHGRC